MPRCLRPLIRAALALTAASLAASGVCAAAGRGDSGGHSPGLRDQWQPQTEHDARLAQPVRVEIPGRAAVPALEVLSKETGVSLQVAPEDVNTVGERKLTVIAQGCSLKGIMVQLPNALQECHWDIDTRGTRPVYLLHRNGGADVTMAELAADEVRRRQEAVRRTRDERVGSARQALAMSPEALTQLARTDPVLAACVEDPSCRRQMELLLSLPPEAMEEFVATGQVILPYPAASRDLQQACQEILQSRLDRERRAGDDFTADRYAFGLTHPEAVVVRYVYSENVGAYLVARVNMPDGMGWNGVASSPAMPPEVPGVGGYERYRDLLVRTGIADQPAADNVMDGLQRQQSEARDRARALGWREPISPELHRVVTLPFAADSGVGVADLQQYVARESGLSIISDFFTAETQTIPDEAQTALPLWQLLYLLGESGFWSYDWNEAGDCLVFHDRYWYRRVPQEFPESVAERYREKLKQQGGLTLDDVAAVAAELIRRLPSQPPWPEEVPVAPAVPEDLRQAGLMGPEVPLLIYAALTPQQRATARSVAGLPYGDLTAEQRELVRRCIPPDPSGRPIPEEYLASAAYRIGEGTEQRDSGVRLVHYLILRFPGFSQVSTVVVAAPKGPTP
jgi:hypothetical protein